MADPILRPTKEPPLHQEFNSRRDIPIGERDALFGRYLDRWLPSMGWTVKDKRGATATFAALLKVGLYEDVLHGLRLPVEEEISAQAQEASHRMLILLQVGAF